MPILDNAKHEEFAVQLSRGVKQGEAYTRAGYAPNKAAASHLAASIRISDRVDELKEERLKARDTAIALVEDGDFKSLADQGFTLEWVAAQYKTIYQESLENGVYGASNTAIAGIQKLIEQEQNKKNTAPDSGANKIDIKDMMGVLDRFTDVVKAAQQNPLLQGVPGDDAIDITEGELK